MAKIINTQTAPGMPWEPKPDNCLSPLWRYTKNPVLDWNPIPTASRIYNSAVVPYGEGYVGVFRSDHMNGRAHIHFGKSTDALNWDIEEQPIQWIDEDGKPANPSYAYDPRVTKIDDTYYICWCDDFPGASIGLGYTKDFKEFVRLPNPFMPFNRNGVLFPRKVNGKYIILSRPSDSGHTPFGDIIMSESPDMIHWGRHKLLMTKGGQGWWQGVKIGTGPVPLETDEGWLMLYHGVSSTCNGFVYSIGGAILDREDPSKVIYRSGNYLLTPEVEYETRGFVPNVIFPCTILSDVETGNMAVYYGAADTFTAVAFGNVTEIVDYIKATHEDV